MRQVVLEDLKNDHEVSVYLACSTDYLNRLGFTEHGKRHAGIVAERAFNVLYQLNYSSRDCELARLAGYLHDIANLVNRYNHGGTGAVIAYNILTRHNFIPEEIALIISAIGNHEEERGHAVNHIAAALILADKSDVHRTRVTNTDFAKFDIHDRVNYAAECSQLNVNNQLRTVSLELEINTDICPVMEYFEIFLERMLMCRKAAEYLHCRFGLLINGNALL